jgi:glycosyltransferase involved in cell wall biosynthesis
VVDDPTGGRIAARDPEAIAAAVRDIWQIRQARMWSRQNAARFSWGSMAAGWSRSGKAGQADP